MERDNAEFRFDSEQIAKWAGVKMAAWERDRSVNYLRDINSELNYSWQLLRQNPKHYVVAAIAI